MTIKILLSLLLAVSAQNTWDEYKVDGMDVITVVGGTKKTDYERVVVLLHGGGGSGAGMKWLVEYGYINNLKNVKYAFPTAPFPAGIDPKTGEQTYVWYYDYKRPDCGLLDDCSYNLTSIKYAATQVAAVIEHERKLLGGDNTKVFLGGFSQGAQMTTFLQIAQLNFALGGAIVMDGFPLPPLVDMPGHSSEAAKKNATYYGTDMRWMFFHGEKDPIFPAKLTMDTVHAIFDVLGVRSTLKIEHIEPGMGHTLVKSEFDMMDKFIRS